MSHSEADVRKHIRGYVIVFLSLLCLTAVSVAASYASISSTMRISVILVIAIIQASLAAAFLMHLISEKKMVSLILVLTGIFLAGLLALPLGQHQNPIRGTSHEVVTVKKPEAHHVD